MNEKFVAGTNLIHADTARVQSHRHDVSVAITALTRLNTGQDTRNVARRLRAYRECTEQLMDAYGTLQDVLTGLLRELQQYEGGPAVQSRRRWTAEQDDALVDFACRDDATMVGLAVNFQRTPAAIASRLTYLVGVARLSRHVVGRITGYLDGEPVSGVFDGELST